MSTADGVIIGTTQIFGTAPRNRAFNVVLLAEGFTTAQQSDFNTACSAFVTALTGTDPFDQLAHAINVFRVNVASTDSGADDPVAAGGTGAAPAHVLRCAASEPTASAGCWSATTPSLSRSPGAGPGVRRRPGRRELAGLRRQRRIGRHLLARAGGATEIALHEMGHTAFGLADEYAYYAGGVEPGQDHHPAAGPIGTQRHDQHRPSHAQVELGRRGRRRRCRR